MADQPQITNTRDAVALARERGLSHVNVGLFDVDGLLRSKRISLKKLESVLEKGLMFCDVIYGWDLHDQIYDNVKFTGWHTGFPDCPVAILPENFRELPFEDGGMFFLGQLDGGGAAIDPRAAVGRILERLAGHGMTAAAGFEYEFFIFDETPESVREKSYRDLKPLAPGFFGYSGLRSFVHSELYNEILEVCEFMGMPLEGLHEESGAGVLEAAITVDDALRSADNAALFKAAVKVLCQRQGLMATFMARWSPDWPGQSGHIHLSLAGKGGPLFYEEGADPDHGISKTMRHFIAGQQALMPELLAMVCPTINSYRRLIPGFWAPTSATWGIENRTCALRAIPGSAASQRVEYRIAPADANPYAALAAALGSGLWGVENEMEPDEPVSGNAYDLPAEGPRALPQTLWDAAQRLRQSEAARNLFGAEFVDHFASTREWEEREFRKHISDWELARYFEAI